MDLVKNPELWEDLVGVSDEMNRKISEAKSWSNDKIGAELENYLFKSKSKRDSREIGRALKKLGPKVHPHVLRILGDKTRREQLLATTSPRTKMSLPETPFDRACSILDDAPPPEALSVLTSFQDDNNNETRKHAALIIASIGTPETILAVRKALGDQDSFVRSSVLIGIKRAIENNCLNERCRQEIFKDLEPLIDGEHYADDAASLMFEFDEARAKALFLSDSTLASGAKKLMSILKTLADRNIPVPREQLEKIIRETKTEDIKYPETGKLAEALRLLGMHKNAADLPQIESFLLHHDKAVAEGAAAAILAFHDLTDFQNLIWRRRKFDNGSALTPEQLTWLSVRELEDEVNNGGLAQYFFNTSGDNWKHALTGIGAIEAREREAILRDAIVRFGFDGPSENRELRQGQLAKLARKRDDPFHDLDNRYYDSKEVVEIALTKYVIKNAAAFR